MESSEDTAIILGEETKYGFVAYFNPKVLQVKHEAKSVVSMEEALGLFMMDPVADVYVRVKVLHDGRHPIFHYRGYVA